MQRCKSKAAVFWHWSHLHLHWESRTNRIIFAVFFIVVLFGWVLPCEMWGTQARAVAALVWTNRFPRGWVSLAVKWRHRRFPLAPHFVWKLIVFAEKHPGSVAPAFSSSFFLFRLHRAQHKCSLKRFLFRNRSRWGRMVPSTLWRLWGQFTPMGRSRTHTALYAV